MAPFPVVLRAQEREGREVAGTLELASGEAVEQLGVLAEHALHQRFGHDVDLPALARPHVEEVGIDGHGGVRHERPRRRGPDQQHVSGLERRPGVHRGEAHVDAGIDHVLVAQRDLVAGQRGPVARTVGDDLVALIEQVAVPHGAQRPPHGLDVGGVERAVGVLEVDPVPDPLGQRVPVLEELEHRLAALLVELGDSVALDVPLALEPEFLLHRDLDGQAVAVPAALALDGVAAHGAVTGEDVLEDAGEDVVHARTSVRRGRALVEDPGGRARAARNRFTKDVALAPALEHLLLELGERRSGIDRAVGGAGGHRRRF